MQMDRERRKTNGIVGLATLTHGVSERPWKYKKAGVSKGTKETLVRLEYALG